MSAPPTMPANTVSGTTNCLECDREITLDEVMQNEIVECPDCGVEYEVVNIDPLELDFAPHEEEDFGE